MWCKLAQLHVMQFFCMWAFFKGAKDPKSADDSQFFNLIDMKDADRPNGMWQSSLWIPKKVWEEIHRNLRYSAFEVDKAQNILVALKLLLFKEYLSFELKQMP